ncbi:hypothetical protein H1C71_008717, partial [Ictidomys tridecemlineatus]
GARHSSIPGIEFSECTMLTSQVQNHLPEPGTWREGLDLTLRSQRCAQLGASFYQEPQHCISGEKDQSTFQNRHLWRIYFMIWNSLLTLVFPYRPLQSLNEKTAFR